MLQRIYKRFQFSVRKTNLKRELIGGLITFFAMIYILPINSNVLNQDNQVIPHYGGILIATALVAGLGSIIMGMYSNLPIGIAPGMGANIFFANTMVLQLGIPWGQALSIVLINGLLFIMLAVSGFLDKFISALPKSIKHAFVFGLGIYLSLIAFKNSGIIEISNNSLQLGNIKSPEVFLTLIGIVLILILYVKKVKMAILITIMAFSILGLVWGQIGEALGNKGTFNSFNDLKFDYSDFSSIKHIFGKSFVEMPNAITNVRSYPVIIALFFMTISGSSGTIVSVGELANLEDENGKIIGSKKGLISIGAASSLSGIFGTSPAGGYLESNAGVVSGARTGISSIVVGILFIFLIPLFPILKPLFNHSFVTSPTLVLVGIMMSQKGKDIKWKDPVNGITSFLMITIMIFSNSILNGMAFGIVIYVILNVVMKKWNEINKLMYVFFILFLTYIVSIPFIF